MIHTQFERFTDKCGSDGYITSKHTTKCEIDDEWVTFIIKLIALIVVYIFYRLISFNIFILKMRWVWMLSWSEPNSSLHFKLARSFFKTYKYWPYLFISFRFFFGSFFLCLLSFWMGAFNTNLYLVYYLCVTVGLTKEKKWFLCIIQIGIVNKLNRSCLSQPLHIYSDEIFKVECSFTMS